MAVFAIFRSLGVVAALRENTPDRLKIGSASSLSYSRFVASSTYRMTSDTRRWRRRVTASYRPLSGSSGWTTLQSNPTQGATDDTVTAGMSIAYDPLQAEVYYAFRSNIGSIVLQAGTGGTFFHTGIVSEGSPSIACAPITGQNCILVSVEPGRQFTNSRDPRLRWSRFSWNPVGGWNVSPTITEPWIMWNGDPQVAVYWSGSGYEYVVSYRQELSDLLTHVYLLRKPADTSAAFSFWGELTNSTGVTPFVAAGSAQDLEVFMFSQ